MSYMLFNCEVCKKEKYIRPSHYERADNHYCSVGCRGVSHQGEGNPAWSDYTINCEWCTGIFKPKGIERKYCSRTCMGLADHAKNSVDIECVICWKKMRVIRAKFGKKLTCSKVCKNKLHSKRMKGDGNSNWVGGKSFEPYSQEFNDDLKQKIKSRDNFVCRLCGLEDGDNFCGNGYGLSIHHIDYDKTNNKQSNLISMCNSCHGKTNYNRDVWKNLLSDLLSE